MGVAFVIRPLGGLVLGLIGDRAGRRLSLSLSLKGVATCLIGVAAPILLVELSCVQGLSVGSK